MKKVMTAANVDRDHALMQTQQQPLLGDTTTTAPRRYLQIQKTFPRYSCKALLNRWSARSVTLPGQEERATGEGGKCVCRWDGEG